MWPSPQKGLVDTLDGDSALNMWKGQSGAGAFRGWGSGGILEAGAGGLQIYPLHTHTYSHMLSHTRRHAFTLTHSHTGPLRAPPGSTWGTGAAWLEPFPAREGLRDRPLQPPADRITLS